MTSLCKCKTTCSLWLLMQSRELWVQASRCRRLQQCLCCVISQLHLDSFVQVFKSGVVLLMWRKQKIIVPFISAVLVLRLCFVLFFCNLQVHYPDIEMHQHSCLPNVHNLCFSFCNFKMFSNAGLPALAGHRSSKWKLETWTDNEKKLNLMLSLQAKFTESWLRVFACGWEAEYVWCIIRNNILWPSVRSANTLSRTFSLCSFEYRCIHLHAVKVVDYTDSRKTKVNQPHTCLSKERQPCWMLLAFREIEEGDNVIALTLFQPQQLLCASSAGYMPIKCELNLISGSSFPYCFACGLKTRQKQQKGK